MPVVNETSENGKIMGAIMLKYLRKCWILNYGLSGKQQEINHLSIHSLDYININIMLQDIFAQIKCQMNFASWHFLLKSRRDRL